MSAGLGTTSNPETLIRGSVDAIRAAAAEWRRKAGQLESVAFELSTTSVDNGWEGKAAEAAAEVIAALAQQWGEASLRFDAGATAIDTYANALALAQGQAAAAIEQYARGEAATSADKVRRDQEAKASKGKTITIQPRSSPIDPGQSMRYEAAASLTDARDALELAGNYAAQHLDALAGEVDYIKLLGAAHAETMEIMQDVGIETMRQIVNGSLSVGNAIIDHPEALGAMFLGVWAASAASAGVGVGGLLSFSGVGAGVGVPTALGSGAIVAGGLAVAGAGATVLAGSAMGQNRVEPWKAADRGDGRDIEGKWADGNPATSGKVKESRGLDIRDKENGVPAIREQVTARVEGVEHGRRYDGIELKSDGTYNGAEIKSGSGRLSTNQRIFDDAVSYDNPAYAPLPDGTIAKITSTSLDIVK
jgi:hypothetical protein